MIINQFLDQFKRSLGVMKKDIRIYYLKGPVVIFGFLMPLFLFLAFFIGSRDLSMDFLISGLISMTVFFTATAVSPVIAPWEAQVQTLERLISAPISITTLIFGDMLASFLFGIVIPILPIVIGLAMGVNIIQPIIFLLGIFLAAACFSSFGLILSSPPSNAPLQCHDDLISGSISTGIPQWNIHSPGKNALLGENNSFIFPFNIFHRFDKIFHKQNQLLSHSSRFSDNYTFYHPVLLFSCSTP
ncbi:MAG: ABC transporter permease [Methanobacterium sp.]|nr:ABC transporter permease [Methanobacterium sp.]